MTAVNLIFPHQLFENSPLLENELPIYLVEEFLFFRQYAFHRQKLVYHRATMKCYQDFLEERGRKTYYIDALDPRSDIRILLLYLRGQGVTAIHYIDPTDDWLERRLRKAAQRSEIQLTCSDNPLFLNSPADLQSFFKPGKKKFFQTSFYKDQRLRRKILVDDMGEPAGGKWTYDTENRKKYPRAKEAPELTFPKPGKYYAAAVTYVRQYFPDNPGELPDRPLYAINFVQANEWWQQFLKIRFREFGPYEDAIVKDESVLHHSVITPMLNVGLLRPEQIVEDSLAYAARHDIPLNSTEGFIRQVIGWREFIRGIYEAKGQEERTRNYWNFSRKIPASFYDGTTGILPVDQTIHKVLKTGYCHHIERLMVLGNFMLLCEFDPNEVYRWFMELFIDAYDWVMVPNVYGMSQFADGGLMATKPYISGSNYLMKMSNFPKGDWQKTWDALFWRFMHVHRDFFSGNPRLSMLLGNLDRMDASRRDDLLHTASQYLDHLKPRKWTNNKS